MSKTSYCLIAIMLAALLYMGAVRGYQFYERRAAEKAAQDAVSGNAFTFQNVPVSLAAPRPEPVSRPVAFDPAQTAIFLESAPLSFDLQQQQAQETIESILMDYAQDPNIQKFNQELADATEGEADNLADLSGEKMLKILQENPQVGKVVQESMQNPEFAKTIEQIFTNPQFIESVKQLQGNMSAAPQPKKAE
ncbi:hypothetical protein [Candidatus Avelusimicrobium gallicola]|uniref:Uncharacterized protein n=1 Tax=Candidatus Avelusimicrobium gallicola TaxID=2562704 RepID=A0A1Y4DEW7_9BACT|nr:hypothetical protein [Elusimicrobium sp. An273]OUO57455.1 hypothetical protein B5F75_01395 [Elusimicrobium sp. An273]